jgi:nucleoside diphosphate kinase
MEQTYVMIKPDGVQRGLIADIIKRFEQKGFTLRGLKMMNVTKELAENHYCDLSSKCAPVDCGTPLATEAGFDHRFIINLCLDEGLNVHW